jgi:uncharacterized FlaG/YvyC family protein
MTGTTVTSLQGLGGAVDAASSIQATTDAERTLIRSVATAVQTVNDSGYLGADRSVTFSVDHASRLPVVKVVDNSTNEVVAQWPPEYLLQLAAEAKKPAGDSG